MRRGSGTGASVEARALPGGLRRRRHRDLMQLGSWDPIRYLNRMGGKGPVVVPCLSLLPFVSYLLRGAFRYLLMRVPDRANFVLLLGPRAVCTKRYIQDTPVVTTALGSLADSVMGYGDPQCAL